MPIPESDNPPESPVTGAKGFWLSFFHNKFLADEMDLSDYVRLRLYSDLEAKHHSLTEVTMRDAFYDLIFVVACIKVRTC
jgi:hypothetical protein